MNIFQAILLGIVQGITEFLPISSSAHLVLFPWIFGWQDPGLAYDVFLHLGTLAALIFYFFSDWLRLIQAGLLSIVERRISFDFNRKLFWFIVFGTVPAVGAGLLFHHQAETVFRTPLLIAVNLSVVGFLLYWFDGFFGSIKSVEEMRMRDAIWIGIAQACAIVPGVSRSGSTMAMARFLGFSREASARFSFLLSMPITAAALAYELKGWFLDPTTTSALQAVPHSHLWAGFLASFLSGLASIHFLLGFLRRSDFGIFAWYRIGLAAFILIWAWFRG